MSLRDTLSIASVGGVRGAGRPRYLPVLDIQLSNRRAEGDMGVRWKTRGLSSMGATASLALALDGWMDGSDGS